jgi:transcriptional regulator with XRE-family HTH domain
MKFNFGEKMKALRKKRDLTQEQLAEYLGVSFQAVSKWETNAAYPDISLFPIIANYYGVTTDELLGVDITKAQEKQKEYLEAIRDFQRQGKLAEMVELSRKACLDFPGNLGLLCELARSLYFANSLSAAYLDEAIGICKKVIDETTDTMLQSSATTRIIYCYHEKGDTEKANDYANQLLNHAPTRQILAERLSLFQGQQEIEYQQQSILLYYEVLAKVMTQYADAEYRNTENKLNHNEKIEILENVLNIQKIIFGDDLCDRHLDAYEYNRIIACIYLLAGENWIILKRLFLTLKNLCSIKTAINISP